MRRVYVIDSFLGGSLEIKQQGILSRDDYLGGSLIMLYSFLLAALPDIAGPGG
jgi:hypothetical protein